MKNNFPLESESGLSLSRALATALLLIVLNTIGAAQTGNTDGTTPAGLKPGAPAGAYGLTGFENVNLYNGNLNFSLPLLQVGGRGSAGYPVSLVVEQKMAGRDVAGIFPRRVTKVSTAGHVVGRFKTRVRSGDNKLNEICNNFNDSSTACN